MSDSWRWGLLVGLGLGAGLCGCEPPAENLQQGELGNGTFEYLCEAPSDAQCDEGEQHSAAAFASLVRGGVFGMGFLDKNGNDANASMEAAGQDRVTYDAALDRWTAEKAGIVALVAFVNGSAADFIHATVVEPTGVLISQQDVSGHFTGSFGGVTIDVTLQSDFILRVAPADAQQNVLAGGLGCQWTSDNEAVARITSDSTDNVITVHPVAAGSATLQVQLGSVSGQTTITVGG